MTSQQWTNSSSARCSGKLTCDICCQFCFLETETKKFFLRAIKISAKSVTIFFRLPVSYWHLKCRKRSWLFGQRLNATIGQVSHMISRPLIPTQWKGHSIKNTWYSSIVLLAVLVKIVYSEGGYNVGFHCAVRVLEMQTRLMNHWSVQHSRDMLSGICSLK